MKIETLRLSGLKRITPQLFQDERGYFFESYREDLYLELGIGLFVQDNVSYSRKNTVRGLHFQSDPGQGKLVNCLLGEIWDVAVDIRPNSPTFMKWESLILSDQNHEQLYIPVGFAHGFCVLSEYALVQYKVSSNYNPATEKSVYWNDPNFQIAWPIQNPVLSPRDQCSPYFQELRDVVDHRQ